MEKLDVTVAVTGMNATDNPAPGVAVARSLRHEPEFKGRVLGLGYDTLDPGFYSDGLLDGGAILPFPSAGREALRDRLHWVRAEMGIDVLIPTPGLRAARHAGHRRGAGAGGDEDFPTELGVSRTLVQAAVAPTGRNPAASPFHRRSPS